jgi:hypothetical protein
MTGWPMAFRISAARVGEPILASMMSSHMVGGHYSPAAGLRRVQTLQLNRAPCSHNICP